jgi:branched-subunit amino acid ABC-type transport system permease component
MLCGVSRDCAEVLMRLLAIGLSNGAVLALNAIGVTLVYGVVRTINFAHGDLFALLSVLAAWTVVGLWPEAPAPVVAGGLAVALAISAGIGALLNAAIERAAFRPFRSESGGASRLAPLIATLGISFVLYQAALGVRFLTNAYARGEHESVPGIPELPRFRVPDLLPDADLAPLLGLGGRLALRDMLMPLTALLLALLVSAFLERTRLGRALRACAQDAEMARLCGVDRDAAIRLAFAIGGALAGAAALIFTLYYTQPYTLYGARSGLLAFTAAVLGGIGRPRGALAAGLLLGVAASLSDYFLAAQWTPVLLLALLMLLLVLRPTGLAAEGDDPATTDHRPPTTDHRPPTTDHRPPTNHRLLTADRLDERGGDTSRSSFVVRRSSASRCWRSGWPTHRWTRCLACTRWCWSPACWSSRCWRWG